MTSEAQQQARWARLSPAKQALLAQRLIASADAAGNRIRQRADQQVYPLSFAQARLWFLVQLEPDSPAYNRPLTLRLNGPLDLSALEIALSDIVQRHQVLQATFTTVDGQPVQRIRPAQVLRLPLVDLSNFSASERAQQADDLLAHTIRQPFDLSKNLFRATLLRLSHQEHILLIVIHHIAFDAWSAQLFVQDLATAYQADEPLPEPPLQYADFADWQRTQYTSGVYDAQLNYWRQQLGGERSVLSLPTDRPRPAVQTYQGASEPLRLEKRLTRALRTQSQQAGVTLFMTLLAAFKVLLCRYTGQEDIIVGSPINNRNRVELEGLIGFAINTLVLRTDLSGDPTWSALLQRVREVTLGAYAHQDLPFEKLVAELETERDMSRHPLFQVVATVHHQPSKQHVSRNGLIINQLPFNPEATKFDLRLRLVEMDDEFCGTLNYNTHLFDATTIRRMADHFQTLLAGIIANPDTPISQLPLLSQSEQHQLLVEWNQTQADFPLSQSFVQCFEAQVERTPDATAVLFTPTGQDRQQLLTYRELNQRANRLAHRLVAEGVTQESLVALLARRCPDFLITMLAIFKAGGAYLPLDPRHPAERHVQLLSQSRCALVLVADEFARKLDLTLAQEAISPSPKCLSLDNAPEARQDLSSAPCCNLSPRSGPDNLAYVIYTSGSTGTPKGAMVEQRGMLNHLQAKMLDLQLSANDTIAQTASQSFDISVWQFLAALLIGGRVHILNDETALNPERLLQEVDAHQISILETVPSMLRAMLNDSNPATCIALTHLRWLIPTGEALPPTLVNQWLTRYPHIPLLNAYGPTECSDDVTHYAIHQPLPPDTMHTPIGRPVANMQAYVLDQAMQPVPIGVRGNLWIGGIGVGRGYLHDAERTASAFIQNPFTSQAGAQLYKTGDLARYLPDGNLEFAGRVDDQVKIRGVRIEPGEIEVILAQHPAVQACVVAVSKHQDGAQRLVAYVVPAQSTPPTVTVLRALLAEKLPEAMIPTSFVILDELPLTPNGKIDRRALPAPDERPSQSANTYVAPRNALERLLAERWQAVLGLEKIGVHDHFFELGGDSIQAAIVINQLQQIFGEVLYVVAIFDAPTIDALATYLQQHYAQAVARVSGIAPEQETSLTQPRIDAQKINQFRQLIPSLPASQRTQQKNPPAIFILSSPRSGSTLFRVMLAGHS